MISYRSIVALGIVAAVGFFGINRLVFAQDAAPPAASEQKDGKKGERRGGGAIFKIVNELTGLTQEQKDKIKAVQTAHTEKMKAMRGDAEPGAARPDKTKMQELMKDSRTQIDAVLTDAQKAELAEKIKAASGDRKGHKGDNATSEAAKQ